MSRNCIERNRSSMVEIHQPPENTAMSEVHEFVALRLCIDAEQGLLSIGLFARDDVQIDSAAPADHIVTCVSTRTGYGNDAGAADQPPRSYVVCDPGGAVRLHEGLGLLIEGLMDRAASVRDIVSELRGHNANEDEE